MGKKYELVYDHRPGRMHKVLINGQPVICRGSLSLVEVMGHRNLSQLGTCNVESSLIDREMTFGDTKLYRIPYVIHRHKSILGSKFQIYSRLLINNKLFRFVRS